MDYRSAYEFWKKHIVKPDEAAELARYDSDEAMLEDAFYRTLEFGTAGMRGVLGLGTNRMNIYTVRRAAQGLAEYVRQSGGCDRGVCIAYDSRNMSDAFAKETAGVLCANGITVYLFDRITSVPILSFSVQKLGCAAGVVITASHNPAKYNGFKIYGPDGGQFANDAAEIVTERIDSIKNVFAIKTVSLENAVIAKRMKYVGDALYEAYYKEVERLIVDRELMASHASELSIVYTPLHGTGNIPVSRVLSDVGIKKLHIVAEQQLPNGDFPTVSAPNPEAPEAFSLAEKLADECGADLILATDPDCDRLGVAVRERSGGFFTLTGNQIGCLLINYLLSHRSEKLTGDEYIVKSIVSTPMADAIAAHYNVEVRNVLTGFKYIAEQIIEGRGQFVFGFEESYGFLAGTFVHDKDACIAAMLVAEAACYYASRGMTLADAVKAMYEKYGYYRESVISVTREGAKGLLQIRSALAYLRSHTPNEIAGFGIRSISDYLSGKKRYPLSDQVDTLELPASDVLAYELDCGSFVIRPSGTEPKLKAYLCVRSRTERGADALFKRLNEGVSRMVDTLMS